MAAPVEIGLIWLDHGRGLPLPRQMTSGAAGVDLAAAIASGETLTIAAGHHAMVPTGLAIASGMMSNQPNIRRALVIGVYMMQRLADLENDPMSFYYGDGAGAVVLEASDKPGFVSSAIFADGSYYECWGIYSSGTKEPVSEESLKAGRTKVKFVTPFPSSVNREGWPKRVREAAKNGNFEVSDIDHIVFTQVRSKTITQVMEDLGLPENKAIKIMHEYGYMGSACIPVAYDVARRRGLIKEGNLVVFMGSGVGYNQCAVAMRV